MKFRITSTLTLIFGLVMLTPGAARANSIGPDCGTCNGNIYTITYSQTGTDSYALDIKIDTSGWKSSAAYLTSIAPEVGPGWSNAALTAAPGGTADWSDTIAGGISNSGSNCDGSGASFFCNNANSRGSFNATPQASSMEFIWTFDEANFDESSVGLKAIYTNKWGKKVGPILSESNIGASLIVVPVPEPTTWALFGSALLLLFWYGRKRWPAVSSEQ